MFFRRSDIEVARGSFSANAVRSQRELFIKKWTLISLSLRERMAGARGALDRHAMGGMVTGRSAFSRAVPLLLFTGATLLLGLVLVSLRFASQTQKSSEEALEAAGIARCCLSTWCRTPKPASADTC
jgi:hypothetical protein